jgi:hypothetical protein
VTLFEDLLQPRSITVAIKARLYPKRPDTFPVSFWLSAISAAILR